MRAQGWADMGYSGGTAHTPNIDKWAKARGSIMMHDFHSGGTGARSALCALWPPRAHQ
jgi:hypothetical protein|eukprot:COSAG01_NODE_14182_length_1486_cov_2.565970_2_plen_58_part_00